MKNVLFVLSMSLGFLPVANAADKQAPAKMSTWAIDPAHTSVSFKVRHLLISTVPGDFSDITGSVTTDEYDLTKTQLNVEIGVASVNTRVPKRDDDLRSSDFFNVEKYPKIKFSSTKVYQDKSGKWMVDGNLTIKEVTKPVTLTVDEGPVQPIKDQMGNPKTGLAATTKINRQDFGLAWSSKPKDAGVGDAVDISINAELVNRAAKNP